MRLIRNRSAQAKGFVPDGGCSRDPHPDSFSVREDEDVEGGHYISGTPVIKITFITPDPSHFPDVPTSRKEKNCVVACV